MIFFSAFFGAGRAPVRCRPILQPVQIRTFLSNSGRVGRHAVLQAQGFRLQKQRNPACLVALHGRCPLKTTERVRQVISGPLEAADLQQRTEEGWKLIAIEWEREVESAGGQLLAEVPFGLQISPETQRLEQNPGEREILLQLMELLVQEGSYAHIAEEINRRGLRTRMGEKWTPVSVFEMLPRLIEVGPQLFQSAEWQKRRQHVPK